MKKPTAEEIEKAKNVLSSSMLFTYLTEIGLTAEQLFTYLTGIGLTAEQAEEVIESVVRNLEPPIDTSEPDHPDDTEKH